MKIRHVITAFILTAAVYSNLRAEDKLPHYAVQVYWHVYEGDPAGSEKEGTKKSISHGWLYPGNGFNSPVRDGGTAQGTIPGTDQKFDESVIVQANVRSATATQVVADVRVDECAISETESTEIRASQGDSYRLAGKFAVDTPYRIWLKRRDEDTPRWAEMHFSTLTPVADEKSESTRAWLPTWRWSNSILPVKMRK